MEIIVDRKWKKDGYTIGMIYIDGVFFCNSLEDKDRGLHSSMSLEEINSKKVYGKTAIPTGTYELKMTYSNRFASRVWASKYGGKVPELLNVKGFSGVRMHPGNTAADTLGCILIGKNNIKGKVTNSTSYYYKLLDEFIVPASRRGEKIAVTIK